MAEANLFDLSVKVNTDGKVVTEFNYIEKNTLVEALNEWQEGRPCCRGRCRKVV
jgi:hypothetical protein